MMNGSKESDARSNILSAGQELFSQKGFSAVGLTEILKKAGVPKGSFYHYFGSKDEFGAVLLSVYFEDYHARMDQIIAQPGLKADEKLMFYFSRWHETQMVNECQGRCLVVKLGAEVSDFSDAMRQALHAGTDGIIARLATLLREGMQDGSLYLYGPDQSVAASLYQLWIGASVIAKISRDPAPFDSAMQTTRKMLAKAS
jgi:TetR/AcrR family transcriptional repressor of nem operon